MPLSRPALPFALHHISAATSPNWMVGQGYEDGTEDYDVEKGTSDVKRVL